jgi:hypothetical protein
LDYLIYARSGSKQMGFPKRGDFAEAEFLAITRKRKAAAPPSDEWRDCGLQAGHARLVPTGLQNTFQTT